MLASFGSWLLGIVLSKTTGEFLQKVFNHLTRSADGAARLEEIRTGADIALAAEATKQSAIHIAARNERQSAKMNWPVFWVIIAIMLGAPAFTLWLITLYNVLWWAGGIWPQPWAVAAYPPSVAPWVEMSIEWLYDPLGAPTGIGAALAAGWVTGRR